MTCLKNLNIFKQIITTYFPEVIDVCNRPESSSSTVNCIQEQVIHHLGVVVHSCTGHSKGHCQKLTYLLIYMYMYTNCSSISNFTSFTNNTKHLGVIERRHVTTRLTTKIIFYLK